MDTIATMRDAITGNAALADAGTITEYLPNLAFLAYTFTEGLTVRIASHGGGKFQATLDGFYSLEPTTADALTDYLASL